MLKLFHLGDNRDQLLTLSRWLLRWGQLFLPVLLGLLLGYSMFSIARDLIVSLTGVLVYLLTIAANPLSGMLLWAISYPFVEGPLDIALGSSIPDLTPTRFCFAFLSAIMLAQTAVGRRNFPRLYGAEVAALLFVLGMVLSAPSAADPVRAIQVIFDSYFIPVLAYFLTRNLVLERRSLDKLLDAFLIIGAYTAVYAIYEQLTGNILFVEVKAGMSTGQYSEHIHVLTGLYGEADAFSVILGLMLPIAFHRFATAPTLGKRVLYAIVVAIMLGGELCTFKRAAWLGLVASLLVIQFFYPEVRRLFLVLVVLFVAMWFIAGDQITESEVGARATYKVDSANGRTERWAEAIELWKQEPLTGHGYKRFNDLSSFGAVENYYLHILVSAGLVAFLPFVTFISLIIKDSIAIFRQSPRNSRLFVDRKVIAIFWGMLAVYLVVSFSNYMAVSISHVLAYSLMGAIVGSQGTLLERRRRTRPVLVATTA
jgi:O-antigen ligase